MSNAKECCSRRRFIPFRFVIGPWQRTLLRPRRARPRRTRIRFLPRMTGAGFTWVPISVTHGDGRIGRKRPISSSTRSACRNPLMPSKTREVFFAGLQAGYDHMLPNRVVLGVIVDASAPDFKNQDGISIGGMSLFTSPSLGPQTFSETMLMSGTVGWLWLCAGQLAILWHRRVRMDPQPIVGEPTGQRPNRLAFVVPVRLGSRRWRRASDQAALDRGSEYLYTRYATPARSSQTPGRDTISISRCNRCALA